MNYRLAFNLSISVVAAFVLLVLILVSIFSNVEKRKTAYYFLWSLISTLIPVGFMIVWYSLRLNAERPIVLVKIFGSLVFITMFGAAYAFLLYCLSFFGKSRKSNKAIAILAGIIGIAFSIAIVVSAFNDMFITYVRDNGINVEPTKVSFIPYTYVWLVFLIEIILLIIKKGMRVGERIAFLAFITVPAIALVFHSIYGELSIFTFAIVASFLAHFLYFYVQRGLMIQKQEKELSEKQIVWREL